MVFFAANGPDELPESIVPCPFSAFSSSERVETPVRFDGESGESTTSVEHASQSAKTIGTPKKRSVLEHFLVEKTLLPRHHSGESQRVFPMHLPLTASIGGVDGRPLAPSRPLTRRMLPESLDTPRRQRRREPKTLSLIHI